MFIGEAPGADEDQAGVPFSGGAGRNLNAWFAKTGIARAECYIDNVIQHRPPGNDIELADLGAEVPSLFERILQVDPNLIVLLGNTPLQVFVDGTISDWRGSLFPVSVGGKTYQALATFHPAFIMRQRRMWDVVLHDLARAKEASVSPGYREPEAIYLTHPTEAQMDDFIFEALDSQLPIAVDIETDYEWTAIDMVGFSFRAGYACCFPFTEDNMYRLMRFFKMMDRTVMQNGLFDAYQLRKVIPTVREPTYDTMLMHHLLYQHMPHDLGFLASIYTLYPFYKDQIQVRKEWYNCRDADTTIIAFHRMMDECREIGIAA